MIQFRTLLSSELENWFDHVALVFDQYRDLEASRQYFMNHWYNDPWRDRHSVFVAVDGDEIVSTVRVFQRSIYLAGNQYTMGGIGEVSTKEAYRRQGISGKLLQMAIEHMEAERLDFSMLGTGTHRHYARYGWEQVDEYWQKAVVSPRKNSKVKLINLQEPSELRQIGELYHEYSSQFNGAIVRDHFDYWRDWIMTEVLRGWIPNQVGRGWGLEEKGEIIAYLIVAKGLNDDLIRVQDFACRGDAGPSFRKLIRHAVASLCGDEPAEAVFPAVIASDFPVEWNVGHSLMIRINNQDLWGELPEENLSDLFHGGKDATYGASKLLRWSIDGF